MGGAKEDVDEELKEELLIVEADASVDPWAVMIHASDASPADGAMVALRGL